MPSCKLSKSEERVTACVMGPLEAPGMARGLGALGLVAGSPGAHQHTIPECCCLGAPVSGIMCSPPPLK
jgi:hypothetical protein